MCPGIPYPGSGFRDGTAAVPLTLVRVCWGGGLLALWVCCACGRGGGWWPLCALVGVGVGVIVVVLVAALVSVGWGSARGCLG
jgi:hypothetical protein